MTFVLATGGIDLTISGIVPTAGLVSAMILNATNNIFLGVAVPLAMGAVVGLANGLLITFFTIPPFLVTLGMQGVFIGVSMWVSNTEICSNL